MSLIDSDKLKNQLLKIADRYAIERSKTNSVTRTIAKAKQEAILEAIETIFKCNSKNQWRYYQFVGDNNIRRVRDGESDVFGPYGSLNMRTSHPTCFEESSLFQEITEAEAVEILGGKPWEEKK